MKRKLVIVLLIIAVSAWIFGMACVDYGCSPGFWKNHTEYWGSYETDELYSGYFAAVPGMPDLTLEDALNLGGGGTHRDARFNVAGMLNEDEASYGWPCTMDE